MGGVAGWLRVEWKVGIHDLFAMIFIRLMGI